MLSHPILFFSALDIVISLCTLWFCRLVLGIQGGNSSAKAIFKSLKSDPLGTVFFAVIFGPAIEELIFRGIPCFLLWFLAKPSNHWFWGIVVSMIFAGIHGFKKDDGQFILPLPQFAGGLVLWYVMCNYSVGYAFCCHALTNAFVCVMCLFEV